MGALICSNPESYSGQTVIRHGNTQLQGECVTFVKQCTNSDVRTSEWVKGAQVSRNRPLPVGTVIATFSGKASVSMCLY